MYQAAQDLADKALTPFTTGLILLDAQNRVSYHNPEALNILTYLTAAKTPLHVPPRILQSLLPGNNISKLEISHIDFKSGRRRYTARSFVLSQSNEDQPEHRQGFLPAGNDEDGGQHTRRDCWQNCTRAVTCLIVQIVARVELLRLGDRQLSRNMAILASHASTGKKRATGMCAFPSGVSGHRSTVSSCRDFGFGQYSL